MEQLHWLLPQIIHPWRQHQKGLLEDVVFRALNQWVVTKGHTHHDEIGELLGTTETFTFPSMCD